MAMRYVALLFVRSSHLYAFNLFLKRVHVGKLQMERCQKMEKLVHWILCHFKLKVNVVRLPVFRREVNHGE